jgi:hypothetical protein
MGVFNVHALRTAGDGVSIDITIEVADGYEIALEMRAEAVGPWALELYEGTVIGAPGTELTPRNFDRVAADGANSTFQFAPTIAGGNEGTLLTEAIPYESAIERLHRPRPWILSGGENYLVRLTNNSGVAADGNLCLEVDERVERGADGV